MTVITLLSFPGRTTPVGGPPQEKCSIPREAPIGVW